ncbi:MAG: tryptophan 7-halogenase [Xanthobacteraceae bacterium]|nr:tryptophan 7-halogenase [Xanthobacteraceae bacterium]
MTSAGRVDAGVCVIGGGPAGAATAARLAALGHDVVVVDAQQAAPVFGASLPASIIPLLERLGVRDQIEAAGFVRFDNIIVRWDNDCPESRYRPGPKGFHVERGRLDALLRSHAQVSGARLLRPARADRPTCREDGRWLTRVRGHPAVTEVRSDIVVDASGGRRLGAGQRRRTSAPTLALYARWEVGRPAGSVACIEAGRQDWMWCAPLGERASIAAIFVDPHRVSGWSPQQISAWYRASLLASPLIGPRLSGGTAADIATCDASEWTTSPAAGKNFVRVGDAGVTLDPLSSQGVQTAIVSSLQAAVVINTIKRRPANAGLALDFYNTHHADTARRHMAKAANLYRLMAERSHTPFWAKRAANSTSDPAPDDPKGPLNPDCRVALSHLVSIKPAPAVVDDFIEGRPALCHPALDRPVAFVGSIEIAPLLEHMQRPRTVRAILAEWGQRHPPDLCWQIVQWLGQRNIVVAMESDACRRHNAKDV